MTEDDPRCWCCGECQYFVPLADIPEGLLGRCGFPQPPASPWQWMVGDTQVMAHDP